MASLCPMPRCSYTPKKNLAHCLFVTLSCSHHSQTDKRRIFPIPSFHSTLGYKKVYNYFEHISQAKNVLALDFGIWQSGCFCHQVVQNKYSNFCFAKSFLVKTNSKCRQGCTLILFTPLLK